MQSTNLIQSKGIKYKDISWDFRKDFTKYSNHGFHTYPAMMIPQVARRLIRTYGKNAKVLLDPFVGSGTALLEATLHNNFEKIDFCFKPQVTTDLAIIRKNISELKNKDVKNFFLVAFSETVRDVSNTRNREYKLYRMNPEMMKKHKPDTISTFRQKLEENITRMAQYFEESNKDCKVNILPEDSRHKTSIQDEEVDLIVTSPPYGDSRTTVAYGQFSRLALQWLGYDQKKVLGIDKVSLGGIPTKDLIHDLGSPTLNTTLQKI